MAGYDLGPAAHSSRNFLRKRVVDLQLSSNTRTERGSGPWYVRFGLLPRDSCPPS